MDAETREFARSFTRYVDAMATVAREADAAEHRLTEVGQLVQDFLGADLQTVEPVTESFPAHQVVDLDLALDALLETYRGERQGISGANREHVDSVSEYLVRTHSAFSPGPVSYRRLATGPDTDRRVVTLGIGMLRFDGVPVAWLQRGANRRHGRDEHTLELLCPDLDRAEAFMRLVRDEMSRLSILRGQVISFASDEFDYHDPGGSLTFLRRPEVGPEQVVLPAGVLDRVTRHVVGVGAHRETLRAAGQHLKRGVLLYGPPGTGKTHLVRHLLSRTPGTTAVLLSGRTLGLLTTATTLARAAQPALIVLEDCDLVAEHRGGDTNAALFETLEAMDGLAADADITFVLTTNRADLLERALVERPGRVDLAVEIPKPDLEGRRRLFGLYGAALLEAGGVSEAALQTAAARTEGVTASFAKEAIRRTVINAAQQGRPPADIDLSHALDEMLSDAEALTRSLLGGEAHSFGDDVDPGSDAPAGRAYGRTARPGLHPGDAGGPDWVISFEGS
ncbi:ATPase family associated with various cellular activities (AAA) [Friedmanniella luteola]|uniref:ATPase family associated with various cellular activities (AAA) n=1 Tax=Friedmanniella luteola TaxID=546871 RepID=A0A1H1L3I0_9ACTN|nr:ATP-binding protein [Friedmanniella luteola]SDR68947.1 ATPase family associated with various cellular activities (AAA) [Friedmanniella luteola]